MARVTVEDCIGKIPNRFDLVLAAAKEARELEFGEREAKVSVGDDKVSVTALREIAADNKKHLDELRDQPVTAVETATVD